MRKVSSHSKGYVNVVIDLLVPYEEDLQRVVAKQDGLNIKHLDASARNRIVL